MKKILFLLLVPVLSMAQPTTKGFEISGTIKGLRDSTLVFLMGGNNAKTVANATVLNGSFILKGSVAEADVFQLGFVGYKEAIDIFIANDTLSVVGEIGAIANLTIKGSQNQADYELFKQQFNPFKEQLNKLAADINQEKDPIKRNVLMADFNAGKTAVIRTAANFAKAKPSSPVSPFVLYVISPLLEGGPAELETYYAGLNGAAKTGAYAKVIEKAISDAKMGAVGTAAMEFSQKDTEGKLIALSSFKGKYVLVDFWASWCGPCRQENPNVVNAYNSYKDKNFTVLGISLDQDKAKWLQAIKADRLTWTHLSDLQYWNNAVAQLYKIQSIPANMLIDPNGKIIGKNLRGEELQQTLKSLLK